MDGMTYQPALPGFRPELPAPAFTSRVLTRLAILHLKQLAVRLGSMELAAVAACLEAADDGDTDEAREALAEAEVLQRMGA